MAVCVPPLYYFPCRKRRNSQSKVSSSTKKRAGTEEEKSESEEEEETPDPSVPTASASGSTQWSVIIHLAPSFSILRQAGNGGQKEGLPM